MTALGKLLRTTTFRLTLAYLTVFALFAAYYRGTYLDFWATFTCVLIMSIAYPVYIMTGQFLLGKTLKYFPFGGYIRGPDAIRFVLMPMLIGVIAALGANVRFYRTVMLDEMGQDYVRTARAKGVTERGVLYRHVLKNAAIPILTSSVMAIPYLLMALGMTLLCLQLLLQIIIPLMGGARR